MTKQECIKQCTLSNGIIKLPGIQLDRKVYMEVKKSFEAIGAKWKGGKTQGFVIDEDKVELFERIKDDPDYNYRKDTKFFETPLVICDLIQDEIVNIYGYDQLRNERILEPSAGRGALIDVVFQIDKEAKIDYCELDGYNQKVIKDIASNNLNFLCDDFMLLDENNKYDLIVANPPFDHGSAQKHLLKMVNHLTPNGTVICVMPAGWNQGKWGQKFNSLKKKNYTLRQVDCPKRAFKYTGISTVIVVINPKTLNS
jgi:16S rRNA G966 N2-methylase RsmD